MSMLLLHVPAVQAHLMKVLSNMMTAQSKKKAKLADLAAVVVERESKRKQK